ncbi:zinc finger protein 652-like [Bradysia coprophila]|uniref:zinc finger protein 652-like n=1 Tax=Bradysia coprophila TaxID=38358 RepID=UPI00187DC08B|nr:zinc finger protein 652-like [Bradysia coprophila]
MQSAVILFCTLHYTIMDEDHRLKCGKMLQLESGQIIFLCKICSGEFISLGLFVRHHRMIHGAIQLQPLQQKNTCEATRWQPSPQTVTHGAVKLQSLQQKITHGATRLPQLTQTVTHSAVKLQPLQQTIAGSLTEKKYPLVVIKRSVPPATQTTSAKKSAPIPPYSSDRDETISFRKLLGYKSPQEETQLRKEFDTEIHRDTCKPKARIKCDYCSKTYLSAGGLRIHMHRHHKLNIPFLCDACPKAFNLPSELTLHRLTHGIERNILCDFCDQQFLTKYQRGIHVKCDHANETYRCTVCFFDSKVLGVVRRHQSLAHGI